MASLHHRLPAALLVLGLIGGCGDNRSRSGAGADTTGAAVMAVDSTATPVTDTGASGKRDTTSPPASDTSAKAPNAKRPSAARHEPKKSAPATAGTTGVATAESTKTAAAPAQDTSKATASAPEAPLRDAYHLAPRDTVSQAVYDGWKQFNLNCARCHGEDVLGTTIAPHLIMSLKPTGPINSKELFVQTVCAGRPEKGMPAWCALGLDMGKINEIYDYVKGRSDVKIGPGRPAVKPQG
jgi:mono/diheme cytochrome c family protein